MVDSIHIVRRYGAVGGMENYVLQLTLALARKGHAITVLCEKSYIEDTEQLPPFLEVIELGEGCSKPRWLGQWLFSRKVSSYLRKNHHAQVIHSHERSALHHVTTFHGPPFMNRKKRFLDFLSPRIHMWSYLEKRELMAGSVKVILPNSYLIAEQLEHFYPSITHKISAPAYPGVESSYAAIHRSSEKNIIGFLGKEWKRKGLDIACEIVERVRETFPDVHFVVAGCAPEEITHLFKAWPKSSYTLAGWVDVKDFFGQINLLIHPARAEPFGMVIAEANAVGIPVVVSDQCGIKNLIDSERGDVIALSQSDKYWADSCIKFLQDSSDIPPLDLSWDALAEQHIRLYADLS